jgi:hypothetical protein
LFIGAVLPGLPDWLGALSGRLPTAVGSQDGVHRRLAPAPSGLRALWRRSLRIRPTTRVRAGLRRRRIVHARCLPAGDGLLPGRVARVRPAAGAGRSVCAPAVGRSSPPAACRRRRFGTARLAGCLRVDDDQVVSTGDQPPARAVLPVQPDLLALRSRSHRAARAASWIVVDGAPAAALPTGRDGWPGPGAAAVWLIPEPTRGTH